MKRVASWFDRGVQSKGDAAQIEKIRHEVEEFTKAYPLPHIQVETER